MTQDVVRALGHLALGTRLKRIGERLQAQTQAVLAAHGVETPAGHFPLLEALARLGPLSIGDLADALGVAQPGVTRLADKLEADGLVSSRKESVDRRVRILSLTPAGRRLVARARRVWPRIEAAVAEACAEGRGPLLARLAALEAALDAAPLADRAQERADASA
ncbi:MAG: MarR family transcriptional regulator [Hydrogenophilaceae bacterium]|jgi:DNA-binding MarR family transcriptional regulator|nr:MarR family transcriptional regulator [Hydrogenophilaceae bacterium]